jgi:hypothetical protein
LGLGMIGSMEGIASPAQLAHGVSTWVEIPS